MTLFRTTFGENIFNHKYRHQGADTWEELSKTLIDDVCIQGNTHLLGSKEDHEEMIKIHSNMEFIAGGRYLYYAGRPNKYFNNCYLLRSLEDSRQDWADLSWKAESCLMTGGGIGNNYSIYRSKGTIVQRTGGIASGPISKMRMINEIGREVMQGGSRRSAIYASLNWLHPDNMELLHAKDWGNMSIPGTSLSIKDLKEKDFNFPAPLDMTNISLNYDNQFLNQLYGPFWGEEFGQIKVPDVERFILPDIFKENIKQALSTGEPGFSFNFGSKENETLRNACTEVTSEDDSDVCNLGSINMSQVETIERFREIVKLSIRFLLCGTLKAELPYKKIYEVREKNRRLGLGLMGVHEWLLKRGYRYEMVDELRDWLEVYREESESSANCLADRLGINRPVAYRAIAPTGTIGILAGTTTGIEPLFAVAYKRRYLRNKNEWYYEYVVDGTAKYMIEYLGVNPNNIESAIDLSKDVERRIKFQADVQDYVDMAISSTINLPSWGTEDNNESKVEEFGQILGKYLHRLRGFTCYPDGSRGGQPLEPVDYNLAKQNDGQVYREVFTDICEISGKGGSCGV